MRLVDKEDVETIRTAWEEETRSQSKIMYLNFIATNQIFNNLIIYQEVNAAGECVYSALMLL